MAKGGDTDTAGGEEQERRTVERNGDGCRTIPLLAPPAVRVALLHTYTQQMIHGNNTVEFNHSVGDKKCDTSVKKTETCGKVRE